MPIIPKIAGSLSVISSLKDIHETALIYSQQEYQKEAGNETVAISIGNQKADFVSFKDARRKNWVSRQSIFSGFTPAMASIKGYCKGAFQGISRYFPKFVLAALSIIPSSKVKPDAKGLRAKSKELSYISAIALALYEAYDFLKNGTELFERRNYLERK